MVEGVSEIVQGSILAGTPASHEADIFVQGLQQIIISHDKMLQNSYKDTINCLQKNLILIKDDLLMGPCRAPYSSVFFETIGFLIGLV